MRKIVFRLSLVIMIVFTLGLMGCNAKTDSLAEYKKNKISELEHYAEEKGIENYSNLNWDKLLYYVEHGKESINVQDTTDLIDNVINATKGAIDKIDRIGDEITDIKLIISIDNTSTSNKQIIIASTMIKNRNGEEYDIAVYRYTELSYPGMYYGQYIYEVIPAERLFHIGAISLTVDHKEEENGILKIHAFAVIHINWNRPNEKTLTVESNELIITKDIINEKDID